MARIAKDTDLGLCVDDARKALHAAKKDALSPLRSRLLELAGIAPQVLLFEGGVEEERQAMALWWATVHHCQQANNHDPCGQCSACLHIGAGIHPDVLAFDGRISNTADAETPGPVRALNKENASALKGKLGDTTRSGAKRVVIISGIDISRNAAANALLKVLEEPSPTTIFVLLTPQREQILPTLVSRSWVATLPWPSSHHVDAYLRPWEEALAHFLQSGQGWWTMTATKGAVTPDLATNVLVLCQKRLITSLSHTPEIGTTGPLTPCFKTLSTAKRLTISHMLDEAQEALQYSVNPARVLDALATQLYCLLR